MPWKKATNPSDPNAAAVPRSPTACRNCGHEQADHDPEAGCLVEGGTRFLENTETGQITGFCSCEAFVGD